MRRNLLFPKIVFKPVTELRFATLGDWYQDDSGFFTIEVAEMSNWKYEFLILLHELTEWAICQAEGISTRACDNFDEAWEESIDKGLVSIEKEAGFDRSCPYRKGHIWGARMERLFCWLLGASWKDYTRSCNEALDEYAINKSLMRTLSHV